MSNDRLTPAAPVTTKAKNLLVVGLYLPGSGLTNVLSVLISELGKEFTVSGLGFTPSRIRSGSDTTVSGRPLHICSSPAPGFAADPDWLNFYMHGTVPEAVIVSGPAPLAAPFLRQLQKFRARTKIILYLPVEGELVNTEICRTLELVDTCVLYTKHARQDLQNIYAGAKHFSPPKLFVVGHGVETSDFFPIEKDLTRSRIAAKQLLFPARPELHSSFLVLNANRIYYRKRLDLTVKGFAKFAAAHPDAYLYLHTGGAAAGQLAELKTVIADSGAAERIFLNTLSPELSSLSKEDLNLLYNACDAGLTTAMGEGWGLTAFEHAATGAPQIVPDHTSFAENWTGAAEMIPVTGREHIFYELADMFTVSPDGVAAALERLYANEDHRSQMALAAYERATAARFGWEAIGNKFKAVIKEELLSAQTFSVSA